MKTRLFAAAAAFVFCSIRMPAADPALTGLVMPGAKVLAGVNLEQARNSPFGQYVLARMQENEQALQELQDATGFDPRRDIREVLVASLGDPAAKGRGLALVRGSFNASRIAAAAQAKGALPEDYNGATLVSDPKKSRAVAFLDSGIAIAGQADEVRAAVDRGKSPTSLDPALAVKVNQLSTTLDAWVISLVPLAVSGARLPDPNLQGLLSGDLLKSVQQTSGGVKFGATVDISAEALTATDQDATALATVLQFLAGMAQANARGTNAAALLQGVTVAADARTVKLSLSVPEDRLEGLFPAGRHGTSGARRR